MTALEAELAQSYSAEQRHGLPLAALFAPQIRFFVARADDAAVGCGGVALFDGFAELKRFYVRPDWRGQGIADALLRTIAQTACDAGQHRLRLEAGIHQPAALAFYRRNGFRDCAAFPPYDAMAPSAVVASVFMEKELEVNAATIVKP